MTGAMMVAVAEMALSADPQTARRIEDGVIEVLSRLDTLSASARAAQ